jgi:hypothetical protein
MLVSEREVAARRAMLGDSFVISVRRWRADPKACFIAPVIIVRGGRRYQRKANRRLRRSPNRGDPDGVATAAPTPHRRPAKEPQCVGGVVTG